MLPKEQTLVHQYLSKSDAQLQRIMQRVSLSALVPTQAIFHDLMSCVVEQQIHYRSTKKVFERALAKADITILTLENYPQFEEKALSQMKLSMRKFETILGVVAFFEAHPALDWAAMSKQEVRATFKTIKGIGSWTVDMLLLYSLERPDIFPADDYHVKNIMTELYGLNTASRLKAQLQEVAAAWAPYRSFGTRWLLAWKANRRVGLEK